MEYEKYSLGKDLKERTCQAWDFTFLGSHLILGIIFFSGLGIWIEFFKLALSLSNSWLNLKLGLIFYPPAVFGSSGIYLLLTDQKRALRTLILLFALIIGIITCGLSSKIEEINSPIYWFFNLITILIALWVWILANSPNKDLFSEDEPKPDASSGGPIDAEIAGDASAFRVEEAD